MRDETRDVQGDHARSGGGGIRTPEGPRRPLAVFKTAAFDRSATPPIPAMMPRAHRPTPRAQALNWPGGPRASVLPRTRRGGRVAEGTRLLSEYGVHAPSRVRIPPSPPRQIPCKNGLICLQGARAVCGRHGTGHAPGSILEALRPPSADRFPRPPPQRSAMGPITWDSAFSLSHFRYLARGAAARFRQARRWLRRGFTADIIRTGAPLDQWR